jgi:Putative transposase, YhgA-like
MQRYLLATNEVAFRAQKTCPEPQDPGIPTVPCGTACLMNPHDSLFKSVFSDPAHAAGALQSCLPPALAAQIDWSQLRLCPGSFVDEQLRPRHTDLLFSTCYAGRETLLYVLYEHQSTADPLMAFRLLRYMVRIWDDLLKQDPARQPLPAILPVVLYANDTPWTASTDLLDLLDLDPSQRPLLAPYLPGFRFVLDALDAVPHETLRARAMSALGRLAFASLRYGRQDDGSLAWLQGWGQVLREVVAAPNGIHALALVLRYLVLINERIEPAQLEQALAGCLEPTVSKEVVMTYGQMLIEQGRKEGLDAGRKEGLDAGRKQGLDAGRKEGRKEGEALGRATMVLRVLQHRGLAVDREQQQRILACQDLPTLDRWIDQVLIVTTTAELLTTS